VLKPRHAGNRPASVRYRPVWLCCAGRVLLPSAIDCAAGLPRQDKLSVFEPPIGCPRCRSADNSGYEPASVPLIVKYWLVAGHVCPSLPSILPLRAAADKAVRCRARSGFPRCRSRRQFVPTGVQGVIVQYGHVSPSAYWPALPSILPLRVRQTGKASVFEPRFSSHVAEAADNSGYRTGRQFAYLQVLAMLPPVSVLLPSWPSIAVRLRRQGEAVRVRAPDQVCTC